MTMMKHQSYLVNRGIKACAVLSAVIIPLLLGIESSAANGDGIKLYNDRHYQEARRAFEQNKIAIWKDPSAAYYYALTLNALEKTEDALEICNKILRCFPRSDAARQSKIAIQRWSSSHGSSATVPGQGHSGIGIVGLKFQVAPGSAPMITAIFPGTPAEEAGLLWGDDIVSVEKVSTKDLSKEQIFSLIIGKPGTVVHISLRRKGKVFSRALKRMHSNAFAKAHPDIWKDYVDSGLNEPGPADADHRR